MRYHDIARPRAGASRREGSSAGIFSFAAPLQDLTEDDLCRPGLVFQIGVAPLRIDVLTGIDGIEFPEAWKEHITTRFADQTVPVLSANHLIRKMRAVGSTQDLADLEWLERHGRK